MNGVQPCALPISLGAGRTGAVEALLPDGTLLLLGGASAGPNGTAQDTGELFHP